MPTSLNDLVDLATFARVVEARSFTAAAAGLGVAKSVASARVARLEARLGVTLLHRTTRRLSLSDEGLRVYEHAARVLAEADAVADHSARSDTASGTVRLDAPVLLGQRVLPGVLVELRARHPALRLEVSLTDRLVDLVAEKIDVAIRISARLRPSDLVARKLGEDRMVVVGAPAYLDARGRPSTPHDLARHDCLRYGQLSASAEWRFGGPGGSFAVPVDGPMISRDAGLLQAAALAGLGLAVIPRTTVAEALAAGELEEILAGQLATRQIGIYVVHAHGRHVPARIRATLDVLIAYFRRRPLDRS